MKYGKKKLSTSGTLFSKDESNTGNKNTTARIIFKNVSIIKTLNTSVFPEVCL
jgi:hypothetical protein